MSAKPRLMNGITVPYDLSVADLATLVESESSDRWAAFIALGHKLEPEALEVLQNKLHSPDWSLRKAAAEAIGYHCDGARAGSELTRLLRDQSPYVVRAACESLGKLKVGSGHDQVLKLLKSEDSATRGVALRTLGVVWQDSDFDFLLEAMQTDTSEDVRKEAAWTLWQRVGPSNWKILFALWQESKQSRERVWACQLAGKYGDDSCATVLRKLAVDKDGHVRKAAEGALQALSL